jgi:glycosyltransferase involved in cell wall biosynthesis
MQETSFEYEIIIHDDASNDGTREILEEYASKYPTLFKLILQDENQYSKGIDVMAILFSYATGKYIALCEGDDYWTDPLKLQKQFDFISENPTCSLCFHETDVVYEDGLCGENPFFKCGTGPLSLETMLKKWTIPTCSVLFHKDILDYMPINPKFQYGDNVLFLTAYSRGLVCCLNGVMGVYRRHQGGWTVNKKGSDLMMRQFIHFNALLESFPMFDFSFLKKDYILDMAAHLLVYNRMLLPENVRQLIIDRYKEYPIRGCLKLFVKIIRRYIRKK